MKNSAEAFDFPPVKFDLQTRFGSIYDEEENLAIADVMKRDAPTSNKKVVEFEKNFAKYCGCKYAVAVSNGTAALAMAYKAVNIMPGDEVITTPITWIATAAAAAQLGAKIIFADIDPNTFNINPKLIKKLITPKTKAICPVHLYGQSVDIDPILEVAHKHNILVIEDSAHAPGGQYKRKMTGNLGDMAIFSFHEQKNMATLGEGGMITTNDTELYERAKLYKSHCARVIGQSTKYLTLSEEKSTSLLEKKQFWFQDFDDLGYNYRMNDITATVGICQLKKLDGMNTQRRKLAYYLDKEISEIKGITPLKVLSDVVHTYHLYPVLIEPKIAGVSREDFIYKMRKEFGIRCGVNYMPLVQTVAFKKIGYSEKDSPIACEQWKNLIILPIHPRLSEENLDYMIKSIKNIIER
jgi:perosamine synthetase